VAQNLAALRSLEADRRQRGKRGGVRGHSRKSGKTNRPAMAQRPFYGGRAGSRGLGGGSWRWAPCDWRRAGGPGVAVGRRGRLAMARCRRAEAAARARTTQC
jgi:hypothetical protein